MFFGARSRRNFFDPSEIASRAIRMVAMVPLVDNSLFPALKIAIDHSFLTLLDDLVRRSVCGD